MPAGPRAFFARRRFTFAVMDAIGGPVHGRDGRLVVISELPLDFCGCVRRGFELFIEFGALFRLGDFLSEFIGLRWVTARRFNFTLVDEPPVVVAGMLGLIEALLVSLAAHRGR